MRYCKISDRGGRFLVGDSVFWEFHTVATQIFTFIYKTGLNKTGVYISDSFACWRFPWNPSLFWSLQHPASMSAERNKAIATRAYGLLRKAVCTISVLTLSCQTHKTRMGWISSRCVGRKANIMCCTLILLLFSHAINYMGMKLKIKITFCNIKGCFFLGWDCFLKLQWMD